MKSEIRLSGSGGQGIILAAIILGEAGALFDKKNVVQTQSYGPESRGGASKAEVIISDEEIDNPKIILPDVVLCLTQEAAHEYLHDVKKSGVIIVDSLTVSTVDKKEGEIYSLPLIKTAAEELGNQIVANIVALGAIVKISRCVSEEAIINALLDRVPQQFRDLNKKALEMGFKLVDRE